MAAKLLINRDPKDVSPEQYRLMLRLYIEERHTHSIERIVLLEVGQEEHVSLPIHAHDFIDYDPALAYTVLHHPKLLLPIFEEALYEAQSKLYGNHSLYDQHKRKGCIKKNCHIRIYSLPPSLDLTKAKLEDISSDDVDCLIQFAGTIVKTGSVRMLEVSKMYECQSRKCMNRFTVVSDPEQDNIIVQPAVCPGFDFSGKCKSTNLVEVEGSNVCVDYQEIKIQDQMERMNLGCAPRSFILVMEADLVDSNNAGEDVVVVGTIIRRWRPVIRGTRCIVDLAVRVNSIRSLNAQEKSRSLASDTYMQFETFWKKFKDDDRCLSGRDVIVQSFCPQLYGLYHVKLSVLLTLIGGTEKKNEGGNSVKTRSQSHLLIVGDPGCGKSQILRFVTSIMSRAVLTTGIGTSGAGLTCTAVRDGQDWSIEAGAMLLANEGVCCIDEFASIKEQDRATIHEVMEQQTLSVAKAGLVMKLNTKTTVIACCNPKGSYDIHADITTNTAIGSPLLSRFDLILILIDTPQKEWDKKVSTFLLQNAIDIGISKKVTYSAEDDDCIETENKVLHDTSNRNRKTGNINSQDNDTTTDGTNIVNTKCWSVPILREYIAFVKQRFHPVLGDEAKTLLMRYYQLQRQSEDRSTARTTVRLLESLMRLSEAHAKLMFRDEVLLVDAVIAIYLVSASQTSTSLLDDYSNLQTDFPSSSEQCYAEHEEKVFRLLHYDKRKLREEIERQQLGTDNSSSHITGDIDNDIDIDDMKTSKDNDQVVQQLSSMQWKQIQDKQKVKIVASRQPRIATTDENSSQHNTMQPPMSALPKPLRTSSSSSSSLSSSSSTSLTTTNRNIDNGVFNFDDFKCKRTIDTTTSIYDGNSYNHQHQSPSSSSTTTIKRRIDNASTNFNDNFNFSKHPKTSKSNISSTFNDMIWEDTNENDTNTINSTNDESKMTTTITKANNIVSMKLKGFDTSDIANDDDW